MVRLDMGLLEKEVFHVTTRNESDLGGGYCKLQLPAPVLQWELTTEQKSVKYYFGTQLRSFKILKTMTKAQTMFYASVIRLIL